MADSKKQRQSTDAQRKAAINAATQPAINQNTQGGVAGLEASFLEGKDSFLGALAPVLNPISYLVNDISNAVTGGNKPTGPGGVEPGLDFSNTTPVNHFKYNDPGFVNPAQAEADQAKLLGETLNAPYPDPLLNTLPHLTVPAGGNNNDWINYSTPLSPGQDQSASAPVPTEGAGASPPPNFSVSATGQLTAPSLNPIVSPYDITGLEAILEQELADAHNPNLDAESRERAELLAGIEFDTPEAELRRTLDLIDTNLNKGRRSLEEFGIRGDETLAGIGNDLTAALTENQGLLEQLFAAGSQDAAGLSQNMQNSLQAAAGGGAQGIANDLAALGLQDATQAGLDPAMAAQQQAQALIQHEGQSALSEFSTLNSAFQSMAINDISIANKQFAGKRAEFATSVAESLGNLESTALEAIAQGNFELANLARERGQMVQVLYQDLVERGEDKERELRQDALNKFLAMVDVEMAEANHSVSVQQANNDVTQANFQNSLSMQQMAARRSGGGGGGGGGAGGGGDMFSKEALYAFYISQGYSQEEAIAMATSAGARNNALGTGSDVIDTIAGIAGDDLAPQLIQMLNGAENHEKVLAGITSPAQQVLNDLPMSDIAISPTLQNSLVEGNPTGFSPEQLAQLNSLAEKQRVQNQPKLSAAELVLFHLRNG